MAYNGRVTSGGFITSLSDDGTQITTVLKWETLGDQGVVGFNEEIITAVADIDTTDFVQMGKDSYDNAKAAFTAAGLTIVADVGGARYGFPA